MIRISNRSAEIYCSITLPLSKSIINRLLVINHLAGNKEVTGLENESDDIRIMQSLLEEISNREDNFKEINELNAVHSGTVMRFLAGVLAVIPGRWLLTGSERMQNRPVKPLADALLQLGADLTYFGTPGYPPLLICGNRDLQASKVSVEASISSQFISSLMLIGPLLPNGLTIELQGEIISGSYIKMTESLMKQTNAEICSDGSNIVIKSGKYKLPGFYSQVEYDWSSAAFWFEIIALSPQMQVTLKGLTVNSVQGDSVLPTIFSKLGVDSSFTNVGLVLKKSEIPPVQEFNYDFTLCPDLAQPVIVTCAALGIHGTFTGLKTLRIKETDRIQALVTELSKFGFYTEVNHDQIILRNRIQVKTNEQKPIVVQSYDDHRMAMSIAPLASKNYEVLIDDPAVVAKSYPGFWNDIAKAGFSVEKVK